MTSKDQGILIAEYTLGLLNPQEMAQAHALLGRDADAAAQALGWEQGFLELTDLLAPVDPSPLLLAKIQTSLGHDTTPGPSSLYRKPAHNPPGESLARAPAPAVPRKRKVQPEPERVRSEPTLSAAQGLPEAGAPGPAATAAAASSPSLPSGGVSPTGAHAGSGPASPAVSAATASPPRPAGAAGSAAPRAAADSARTAPREKRARGNIWIWRAASLVFAAIALALGLMPAKPVPPAIKVVEVAPTQAAILQAPGQSSTPGWVVTVDPQQNVLLDPQVRSDIPADASVQLWTHNRNIPQPRSLGLIDPNKPVTVPATLMGGVSPDQIFEMTLEPAGGSPTAAPTGPVLFIGRIVTFGKKRPPPAGPAAGPAVQPPANS